MVRNLYLSNYKYSWLKVCIGKGPFAAGVVWIMKEMRVSRLSGKAFKDYSAVILFNIMYNINTFV